MQKDYQPSEKYTQDDFENLNIPYKFRDYCQDQYAQYLTCVRARPKIIENSIVYVLPMSDYFTGCKVLRDQWKNCQTYREKELFEDLRNIFEEQRKTV